MSPSADMAVSLIRDWGNRDWGNRKLPGRGLDGQRNSAGASNFSLLGVLGICAAVLLVLGGVGLSGNGLPIIGPLYQEEVSATDSTGEARAKQPAAPDTTAAVASTTTDPFSSAQGAALAPKIATNTTQPTGSSGAAEATSKRSSSSPRLGNRDNRQHKPPTAADDQPNNEQNLQLAISGRVLDDAGEPIPGIELILTPVRLFDDNQETGISLGAHEQFALTDFHGLYTFENLADGEYRIRSMATGYYAPGQKTVRAGVSSADLVLAAEQELRVHGVVANTDGTPLAGVQVTPILPWAGSVTTDQGGQYQFHLALATTRGSYSVRFQHAAYREKFVRVLETDWLGQDTIWVDASLEPVETVAVVEGSVRNSAGLPLAGEVVQLYSPRLRRRYHAATDQAGQFMMRDVETAQDYRLSIHPSGTYQDYEQRDLRVTAEGLRLDLVLEGLSVGRFAGYMVDVDGNPIPRFSLLLRSETATNQWIRVTGDSQGYFFVNDVPAGALTLRTTSSPLFTLSGIDLPAGDERQLPLVLDWGAHVIDGWVVDSLGQPVPMARVTVSWVHQDNRVRSWSSRDTVADAQGNFRFDQLGPGQHTVHINAPGFDQARLDHDVTVQGPELVVQLNENI